MAKVPLDAVDASQLGKEKGWKFEELAQVVGTLYLESNHQIRAMKEQMDAMLRAIAEEEAVKRQDLEGRIRQLEQDKANLKAELDRRNNGQSNENAATNVGKD